ncbi:uncharacterized protein NEMAJ01_0995 [Nematocida major]|uniref:uncharacterized protein n=1 Tax=Nematocida major TaxID=1912982 RepID=UPI0020084E1F|nr:uncharacterized protein NEMAJ01_0995 [Nematocida major]KAH9386099.1 hypothetical protein NEMAJ01_0995 [Nematocida major]
MGRQTEIKRIENELVGEKPWFEKGEVSVKERPKNSLLQEEDCDSDEFVKNIEFIRSRATLKIEDTVDVMIERVVKDLIKKKEYSNPRKVTAKTEKEAMPVSEQGLKEESKAVHDILDGRRTENDKFMNPNEMIKLFNEIDSELAAISDKSYTITRPMATTDN